METRHADSYRELAKAVLHVPGDSSPELRAQVEARAASLSGRSVEAGPLPGDLGAYVDKLAQHAYRVVDADIDALKQAGLNEDAVFELTLAAALGAAAARFERADAVLKELP